MLNILVGAVLGFLSGLGVGGGSLLLMWLTLAAGYPGQVARVMNLMFFLPCAAIATAFRWKHFRITWSVSLPAIIAALLGAYFGTWLSPVLSPDLLKKALGVLFLLAGLRELRQK